MSAVRRRGIGAAFGVIINKYIQALYAYLEQIYQSYFHQISAPGASVLIRISQALWS